MKRVMDVLDIFLGVREKMPARLLLVGDGPDRARLEGAAGGSAAATRSPSSATSPRSKRC
ncbi:MAG: hypothetical protein R2862_04575 [Thermoanaerobaculia bacterium]